jgi:hypothetical protein
MDFSRSTQLRQGLPSFGVFGVPIWMIVRQLRLQAALLFLSKARNIAKVSIAHRMVFSNR